MEKGEKAAAPREVDSRLLQANERTMLAWVRTSVTLMGFGFVVARLTLSGEAGGSPSGPGLALGLALVSLGVLCNFAAARRFLHVRRALLEGGQVEPDIRSILALAIAVAAIGLALGAGLLLG